VLNPDWFGRKPLRESRANRSKLVSPEIKVGDRITYIFTISVILAAERSKKFGPIDTAKLKEMLLPESGIVGNEEVKQYFVSWNRRDPNSFACFIRFVCESLAEADLYGYSHQYLFNFDMSHLFSVIFECLILRAADRQLGQAAGESLDIIQPLGVFLEHFAQGNLYWAWIEYSKISRLYPEDFPVLENQVKNLAKQKCSGKPKELKERVISGGREIPLSCCLTETFFSPV